jgi:hypothetical protein
MRNLKMVVLGLALFAGGMSHAFSAPALTAGQKQTAQQVITQKVKASYGAAAQVMSIRYGFGRTPRGFIGRGFPQATVKVDGFGINPAAVQTLHFTVIGGLGNSVNVIGGANKGPGL